MTATSGWPGVPGVPRDPEKDGWHIVQEGDLEPEHAFWRAKPWLQQTLGCWQTKGTEDDFQPYEISNWRYLGPCLTFDEATALQARVTKLETALQFIKDAPEEDRKPNWNNMGSYEAGLRYCAAFARAALEGKKDE